VYISGIRQFVQKINQKSLSDKMSIYNVELLRNNQEMYHNHKIEYPLNLKKLIFMQDSKKSRFSECLLIPTNYLNYDRFFSSY